MALDHIYVGPLFLQQVDLAYLGQPSKPGAIAAGFLYDPVTGEFASDENGSVYQCAAMLPITIADIPDTTALRARLVEDLAGQFVNIGVLAEGVEVTAVWTDYTPPPTP